MLNVSLFVLVALFGYWVGKREGIREGIRYVVGLRDGMSSREAHKFSRR